MNNWNKLIEFTLILEEDTKFQQNYEFGRKIENEGENVWINLDLTKTEREIVFEKRKQIWYF